MATALGKIIRAATAALMLAMAMLAPQKALAADDYSIVYQEVSTYCGDSEMTEWLAQAILYASGVYGVDPLLVTAIMEQESGFSMESLSSQGAIGLMQLMPGTAEAVGVNPYDPMENIIGGVSYLRTQLDSFSGYGDYAVTNAVAAYNAGGEAVRRYGGVPPYNETMHYVQAIGSIYRRLLAYCDDWEQYAYEE